MPGEAEEVTGVLRSAPGRTATEVRDALRALGRSSVTTADVWRVLGAHPRLFKRGVSGESAQRWWPAGPGRGDGASPLSAPHPSASMPDLYRWQTEALEAWRTQGGRGVVEAVTGTGKTMVGVHAVIAELAAGGQACVVVPTRDLLHQWGGVLSRQLPQGVTVGLLGDGRRDGLGEHDVVIAVVNSARGADLRPRRPGGLLVADECHRYGSEGNHVALRVAFPRRLGLSATYARSDDGHLAWLDPYFGGTCYRIGYSRAIADGVVARFTVDLVAVRFSDAERGEYDELCQLMSSAKAKLIAKGTVPGEPFGQFIEAVARLARQGVDGDAGLARSYLAAMQGRRRLMAETPAKLDMLARLASAVQLADRAIIFTHTIAGAEHGAAALRQEGIAAQAVHSGQSFRERRQILASFDAGAVHAVVAPQVLDEGVDVPAADLAIILASSRSRRQMVQRMGRVLRRKPDGRMARFVIVFVEGTVEDPVGGAHEGFLDEVTGVAEAVRTGRGDHLFAPS